MKAYVMDLSQAIQQVDFLFPFFHGKRKSMAHDKDMYSTLWANWIYVLT